MKEEEYLDFLKTAPENHFSDEFIQFLRDKPNKVIEETDNWLIIENCKDPNDYTAFWINPEFRDFNAKAIQHLTDLLNVDYGNREWVIKAPHKRTVKLFHVHLISKK